MLRELLALTLAPAAAGRDAEQIDLLRLITIRMRRALRTCDVLMLLDEANPVRTPRARGRRRAGPVMGRWQSTNRAKVSRGRIMLVSEVYRPELLTCQAGDLLPAVARKMAAEQVSALAVVDESRIVGIISERDVTRAVADEIDLRSVTASQYASTELEVAMLDDYTHQIALRMLEAGVRHLPVMHDNALVGMVSMRDLLAAET
jgi:CBS domain-containing protein